MPSLEDRNNMPYIEAVIYKTMRMRPVAAVTPHRLLGDMVYQGYHLPKGAMLFGNIYGAHHEYHDPKVWKYPSNFRPERFLNEDQTKLVNLDALITFSEEKMKCVGETMGKDSMFLFVTGILQKFNILPENLANGGKRVDFEADFGILLAPKPYKVVLKYRKDEI